MTKIQVTGNEKELKLTWAKERFERAQIAVREAVSWYEQCQHDLKVIEENLNDSDTLARYEEWYGIPTQKRT